MKMKVLSKSHRQEGFSFEEKEIPKINAEEVLIKVVSASLCGTDMHIYHFDEWSQNRVNVPLTIGHELSGRVIEVGENVTTHKVGDIVACETHIVCNECDLCLSGNAHVCKNTKIIGVDVDGAFAPYIAMPAENCRIQESKLNPKYLSVLEPLGNAVHTVLKFDVLNKDVAIVGCGPIGLMAVNVAKAEGAKKIIAVEINEYRRNLAKKLGATHVINPLEVDVVAEIMAITGEGIDVGCEFSGNEQAIQSLLKYMKLNGKVSMLGIPPAPITIDLGADIVFKGLTLYGVVGRKMYETWEQVEKLIKEDKIDLETVVTHEFKLEDYEKAVALMDSGNCGKIIFNIGGEDE